MEEGTYPPISIFLYEDNTVRMESNDNVFTGTFEMSNDPAGYLLSVNDTTIFCAYDADTGLLYIIDDVSGTTGAFALRVDLPAELNAESIDEFQGNWRVNYLLAHDRMISTDSDAGAELLSNSSITDPVVTINGTKVNFFGMLEGDAELVDGALVVTTPNGTLNITLTEGDGFVLDIPGGSMGISRMYADKE